MLAIAATLSVAFLVALVLWLLRGPQGAAQATRDHAYYMRHMGTDPSDRPVDPETGNAPQK